MNKLSITLLPLALALTASAQQGKPLTNADYARAESFLAYGTAPLVDHAMVMPNWLPGNKFWYRVLTEKGSEFVLVDPEKGTRLPAFDATKLAESLSKLINQPVNADMLPFSSIGFADGDKTVTYTLADGSTYKTDLQTYQTTTFTGAATASRGGFGGGRRRGGGDDVKSPDGTKTAYIKDYNLWVKDIKSQKETQLTTDGIKDFGYATDNAGWKHSDAAILRWSPDSKKIATFKQDQRQVSDMYLVSTQVGKPALSQWKYPLPGDLVIPMISRVVINVDEPKVIPLQIPADPHRATLSDDISSSGTFDDIDWSPDGAKVAFVSTSRDHKQEKVRIADAATGAVQEVFEEDVKTQFESGWGAINWRYLAKTNEIIWFSERDNYGHLYLYDAVTGKVKNRITNGNYVVTRLLKVDEKTRTLYFIADGLQADNPYFSQLCKVGFDGKHFTILTPEAGNHNVSFSPDESYI